MEHPASVLKGVVRIRSSLRDLNHHSTFPALKRWAKLGRPSGAHFTGSPEKEFSRWMAAPPKNQVQHRVLPLAVTGMPFSEI
jgi:hypothetical protein